MGLLVAILAGSGLVFSSAVKAKRAADATTEIARKLATITDQLTSDFKGLRKDGEIFLSWMAGADTDGDDIVDRYGRFDRIMFFANGDFHSYHTGPNGNVIHGNIARICYMLARNNDGQAAQFQDEPSERILSRTQHIYTSESSFPIFPDMTLPFDEVLFKNDNYNFEYETTTFGEWKLLPNADKFSILTIISDVTIGTGSTIPENERGTTVDPADPCTIHMLFCEGVGEFSIQGWDEDLGRWVPQLDPDNDGDLSDTDFIPNGSGIDAIDLPGILYPDKIHEIGPGVPVYSGPIDEANFNQIPGFGKAFKFTFTLYDSMGVFPKGKTFTHIVYLN